MSRHEGSRQDGAHRIVVSSFLVRAGRVLLLLRSRNVGTYRGRWAGVSGYLEDPTPRAQAVREIREETGLEDLACLVEGEALEVNDEALGIRWTIHPFLFEVPAGAGIRIDRESTEARWFPPEEIGELPHVPSLVETLDRVLPRPDLPGSLRVELARVLGDRVQGASEIARGTLETIGRIVRQELPGTEGESLDESTLRSFVESMASLRPAMAPLENRLGELLERVREPRSGLTPSRRIEQETERMIEEMDRASESVAERLAGTLRNARVVVTLSRSSTVLAGFRRLVGSPDLPAVRVLVSLPLGEGETTAAELRSLGYSTSLHPDSAAALAVQGADLVVFGADSLLPGGDVVNKTGSFPLAAAARACGVDVVVAAETFKTRRTSLQAIETVEGTPLFEVVPDRCITRILTEDSSS